MTFRDLGLEPRLLESIDRLGFETPTPIQVQCFPPADAKKNIVGIAQTGTGKTLAFLLPIVNRIYRDGIDDPNCVILAPTRELCVQISEELERLTQSQSIRIATIYGGEGYNRQERELAANPHIIVATPGRLIDFMKQGKVPLKTVGVLVLDEADRMFDMGFIRDIRYVMRHIPEGSQVMLFTATMSYYVLRLVADFMGEPEQIKIDTDRVEVEKIDQQLYHLGLVEKMPYLVNTIRNTEGIKAIVFTNSRHRVQDIARVLCKYGIHATGISSLLDQKKRIHLLKSFKTGKYNVLVATDVASRGLDIDDITHVFNYDLPLDAESYVHRIGRTARAGKEGTAISFCSEMDYECLPRIEVLLEHKIPTKTMDPQLLTFPPPSPIHIPEEDRLHDATQRRDHERERPAAGDGSAKKKRRNRKRSGDRNDNSQPEAAAARPAQGERPARGGRPERQGQRHDAGRTSEEAAPRKGKQGEASERPRRNDRDQDHKTSGRSHDGNRNRHDGARGRDSGRGENRRQRGGENRRDSRGRQTERQPKKSILQRIIGFFKKG